MKNEKRKFDKECWKKIDKKWNWKKKCLFLFKLQLSIEIKQNKKDDKNNNKKEISYRIENIDVELIRNRVRLYQLNEMKWGKKIY